MAIDDVIRDLSVADNILPEASLRWALDHWEEAAPDLIAMLERCADGSDRSDATKNAVFFIIHLLGEKREARGFPALCRLLEDAEACEAVLGDALTETLRGIIISTYDGDARRLKTVIEAPAVDQFARAAALDAMTYLSRSGVFTDDEMRGYMLRLRADMQPQGPSFIWTAWALAAANLGYGDYAGQVEQLIRDGFIPRRDMDMADFNRQLSRTRDDPSGISGFGHDRVQPFTDTIGALSTWYGFSEEFRRAQAARAADREEEAATPSLLDEPHFNPLRHVGRNDPCPCGSGKKYKKCCLP